MDAGRDLVVDTLILLVVGAHLRAELDDRPHAQRLCEAIGSRLRENGDQTSLKPVVCTDVWYLNNQDLLDRPAIAIGDPGVNAATAYLSNRLPTAMVIDHTLRIQLDPEYLQPQACLWGSDAAATGSAVDMFIERYLEAFLAETL